MKNSVASSRTIMTILGRFLGPLTRLPLIGNVLKPLAKSVLTPLGVTPAASATDEVINKKMFGSGNTTSIVSNEEMHDIMKIITSLNQVSWRIWSIDKKC